MSAQHEHAKSMTDESNFGSGNFIKPYIQRAVTILSFYFYLQFLYFNLASVVG